MPIQPDPRNGRDTIVESIRWRIGVDNLLERLSDDVKDLKSKAVTQPEIALIREKLQEVPTRSWMENALSGARNFILERQDKALQECQGSCAEAEEKSKNSLHGLERLVQDRVDKLRLESQESLDRLRDEHKVDNERLWDDLSQLKVEFGRLDVKRTLVASGIGAILGAGLTFVVQLLIAHLSP